MFGHCFSSASFPAVYVALTDLGWDQMPLGEKQGGKMLERVVRKKVKPHKNAGFPQVAFQHTLSIATQIQGRGKNKFSSAVIWRWNTFYQQQGERITPSSWFLVDSIRQRNRLEPLPAALEREKAFVALSERCEAQRCGRWSQAGTGKSDRVKGTAWCEANGCFCCKAAIREERVWSRGRVFTKESKKELRLWGKRAGLWSCSLDLNAIRKKQ